MDRNTVAKKVKKVVADVFNVSEKKLTEKTNFIDDLHAKSMEIVELLAARELEFGFRIPQKDVRQMRDQLLGSLPFSDLKVTDNLLGSLPEGTIIELGNSSPVRLSQFSKDLTRYLYYSNRGVSGIDGSLSTAVGTALSSGKMTFALLGDLGFVYDSNALWNRELPSNLRIVVLNNRGGQIFSLIPGPDRKPAFKDYFIAHHPVNLQKLAEAFNLNYFCASNEKELADIMPMLLKESERAVLAEIRTDPEKNQAAFNRIMGR